MEAGDLQREDEVDTLGTAMPGMSNEKGFCLDAWVDTTSWA